MRLPGTQGPAYRPAPRWRPHAAHFYLVFLLLASPSRAADTPSASELKELSLEQLMSIEVTSVTRTPERLFDAPAAIYVLTQDDLRRSGATSIPEALRNVPGLQVARVDASTWAITVRGFNGTAANKLLVLIDGRSVYTPLYSGVFWDVQDVPLEEIDRIEIIRGPGGTMWGANAVNGVINIITTHAHGENANHLSLAGGTVDHGAGSFGLGSSGAGDVTAHAYGKFSNRDHSRMATASVAPDDWWLGDVGGQLDWHAGAADLVNVSGQTYLGDKGQTSGEVSLDPPGVHSFNTRTRLSGGSLVAQWNHASAGASEWNTQAYVDQTHRRIPSLFEETRWTFDVDMQNRRRWSRHQVVWGAGVRATRDEIVNSLAISWDPANATQALVNLFVQDEAQIVPNRLTLTLGSKLEYTADTHVLAQPNVRLLWSPTSAQRVWTSVSRAVRTPTRLDRDAHIAAGVIPGSPPTLIELLGDKNFMSESVVAYEIGYRIESLAGFAVDATAFYNDYADLRSIETGAPFTESDPAPEHRVIPYYLGNGLQGQTRGAELAASRSLGRAVRLHLGYSHLVMTLHAKAGSTDALSAAATGDNPKHQVFVRASVDLPKGLELDPVIRYVDALPHQRIPSYVTMDVRLGARVSKVLDAAIGGRNLLSPEHREFGSGSMIEIRREVYGSLAWHF